MFQVSEKAWVVAVDMGYGHQRTAYPLKDLAFHHRIINANHYEGIPLKDRRFWSRTRVFYEFLSRFRKIPFVGEKAYAVFDSFQKIMGYYPKRDLSKANIASKVTFSLIRDGWGRDLVERLARNPHPLVTTFFTPAFMAEEAEYPNDIYCVICDADIARAWVNVDPANSRIKYFAPCTWSRDRLKLYGVRPEQIMLTGYPLPKENLGGPDLHILKRDLRYRLLNLDPQGKYRAMYAPLVKEYLGELPSMPNHPLTIMFSIGGAGAQKEIGVQLVNSLKDKIRAGLVRVILSVGTKDALREYFASHINDLELDGWVHILSGKTIGEYFEAFNRALRTTDILWTKPSELSFYAALGIPIIIAPTLGSQEDFNKRWLLHIGAGTLQDNPKYANQWIFDLLQAGDLAEMAMQGFVEIEQLGTYQIENILSGQRLEKTIPMPAGIANA